MKATAILLRTVLCLSLTPVAIVFAQSPRPAASAMTPENFERLMNAVQNLQDENTQLRTRVEQLERERGQVGPLGERTSPPGLAMAAQPSPASVVKPQTAKPPVVLPWGQESSLKLGGFIQINGEFGDAGSMFGVFPDSKTVTPLRDRIFLRRARINLAGDFAEHFDFKLEGDFEQGDGLGSNRTGFSGTDIFLNWNRYPESNIRVGQFKAPFGLEQTSSDTTIYTIERTQATGALTPEREIGVQLWGKPLASVRPEQKDLLEYAVGVFNGNNRNTQSNDNANFMYVGRIASTLLAGKVSGAEVKWKVGVDGLYTRYGAGTRISQTGNLKFNADGALSGFSVPATAGSAAKGTGWAVNQSLTAGPFDLIAEYLQQKVKPLNGTPFSQFTANGYYVLGGYFFPGRKFQLVGEYESFNPGQAGSDDIKSLIGGLNYYLKGDHLKLMFDYVHARSDFRAANPAAGRAKFDEVLVRTQVLF